MTTMAVALDKNLLLHIAALTQTSTWIHACKSYNTGSNSTKGWVEHHQPLRQITPCSHRIVS